MNMKFTCEDGRLGCELQVRFDEIEAQQAPSASVKGSLRLGLGVTTGTLPMCQVAQGAACSKGWIWQTDGGLILVLYLNIS